MKVIGSMQLTAIQTDWGWLGLAGTGVAVHRVLLPQPSREAIARQLGGALTEPGELSPLLRSVAEKIERYTAGERVAFDEPVELAEMGEFHRRVLQVCREIPYGSTCAYGELAARAGRPGAARAVGAAMARNPVPILVPCHRVIRSDGSLGGFGGGLELKRRMLQLESLRVDGGFTTESRSTRRRAD